MGVSGFLGVLGGFLGVFLRGFRGYFRGFSGFLVGFYGVLASLGFRCIRVASVAYAFRLPTACASVARTRCFRGFTQFRFIGVLPSLGVLGVFTQFRGFI